MPLIPKLKPTLASYAWWHLHPVLVQKAMIQMGLCLYGKRQEKK